MKRADGRTLSELRPVKISRHYLKYPAGSVLIEFGQTKVICAASVQEKVPDHKRGSGEGWVTAEYAMLPGATQERSSRERQPKGRTQEIQRLIGRSLRAVVDLKALGERTITLDADVLQADGGTRTAAITGCFIALHDAINKLSKQGKIKTSPLKEFLAAVSVGVINGQVSLDLPYEEDSRAEVDLNLVMTESGKIVEVQGTAEGEPFSKKTLDELLAVGAKGIKQLIAIQKKSLK